MSDGAAGAEAAAPPPLGHLILVGLPGAGKSTLGRRVARRLGRRFVDFDAEIEHRTGRSVPVLFAERGEPGFRALEVELTRELASAPPMVWAPGGGWITNEGILERVRPPAHVVHLRVSPFEAHRRLQRSAVVRPLLRGPDPLAALEALWARRASLYARADTELSVELIGNQRVISAIVQLARDLTPGIG